MILRLTFTPVTRALIALILLAGCVPSVAIPTMAVLPTQPPATPAAVETRLPATATDVPALPTLTAIPTIVPTLDPEAVSFDDVTASYASRRVTFLAYLTPRAALLTEATLSYTFPSTGQTQEWRAALPVQRLGEPLSQPLRYTIGVDQMPPGEDTIRYHWRLTTAEGAIVGPEATFRITEAISAERRDDLPIMPAEMRFESEFPERAVFTVTFQPDPPINNARFYLTQNRGIVLHNYAVHVPTQAAGEPLTLRFTWNDQLSPQIPWQQFEWWWVVTDRMGRQWRTEHRFDEYADNRFHRWTRTPTRHAVLFTYDQPRLAIDVLAEATDSSIERLERAFGYRLIYRPHIVVYNQQRDFEAWAPPGTSERFVGMASGEWGGAVVTIYDSLAYTGRAIIQHELVHLFQFQSIRERVPVWWMEGSATYFEEMTPVDIEAYVRLVAQRYSPPNVAYGVRAVPPDGSTAPWPYFVGYTFIRFLYERYGEAAFRDAHIAFARDMRFPDALRAATGASLTDLAREYAAWIAEPAPARVSLEGSKP